MNAISYCFLELGCSCFDFTWARVRKNRAQGIRTKVIGKRWFLVSLIPIPHMCLLYHHVDTWTRHSESEWLISSHLTQCLNVIGCLLRLSFWFYSFDPEIQADVNAYMCGVSNSFGSLVYGMFGALQLAVECLDYLSHRTAMFLLPDIRWAEIAPSM
jgi:hypothetical protein